MSAEVAFVTAATEVELNPSVRELLARNGLTAYTGPRVPLPGCSLDETPTEFLQEWFRLFDHFRNEMLMPLTRCSLGQDARRHVRDRARIACEKANREMKRRYGR